MRYLSYSLSDCTSAKLREQSFERFHVRIDLIKSVEFCLETTSDVTSWSPAVEDGWARVTLFSNFECMLYRDTAIRFFNWFRSDGSDGNIFNLDDFPNDEVSVYEM